MGPDDLVWSAVFGAAYVRQYFDERLTSVYPDEDRRLSIYEEAETIADLALEEWRSRQGCQHEIVIEGSDGTTVCGQCGDEL